MLDCELTGGAAQNSDGLSDPLGALDRQSVLRQEAVRYLKCGWTPYRLKSRDKKPPGKKEQNIVTRENVDSLLNNNSFNIGVLLGKESDGLVDLDFDWPEARVVGTPMFSKAACFGRPGARSSHRLVKCKSAKTFKFSLPSSVVDPRLPNQHALTVLEIRASGHTMFPPSIHPNGETVEWENQIEPPTYTWPELRRHAGLTAFLAVCIRLWPQEGSRDDTAMALAGALLSAGLEADAADRAAKFVARAAGDEEFEQRGKAKHTAEKKNKGEPTTGLPRLVELLGLSTECVKVFREWLQIAANKGGDENELAEAGTEKSGRRIIRYLPSELVRVLDESEAAILESGLPIYQTSGRLVHPVRHDTPSIDDGVRRAAGALVVRDVSHYWLRELFMRAADYRKPERKKDGESLVPCAAPLDLAHQYLAREGRWNLPVLRAVVEAPTMRPDGTIVQKDGYDPSSGFLIDTRGVSFPTILENPTEADAREALPKLKEIFSEFPFEGTSGRTPSRSVALSAVLTALSRRGLRTAPMHAFSAPTMGTGKSLLAEIVSIIATGRTPAVTSQGKNDEEDEKRLLSILMQGDPIVVIDNVERPVQGDALCSILTQEVWQSRQLGASKQIRVSTNVLFLATGNNLAFRGDMSTRAVLCRVDANMEEPETRRFRRDLRKDLPGMRPELVAAGLTILRAFVVAGRPGLSDLKPFGRFEDWSNLVRGALVWLGEADPCDTRDYITERDSAKEELWTLLDQWRQALGTATSWSAREVLSQARNGDFHDLQQAIEAVCPYGATPKSFGRFLTKADGRIVDGLRIRHLPDKKRGGNYRVEECSRPEQLKLVV